MSYKRKVIHSLPEKACDMTRIMRIIQFSQRCILCLVPKSLKNTPKSLVVLGLVCLFLHVISATVSSHAEASTAYVQETPTLSTGNPLQSGKNVKLIKGYKGLLEIDLHVIAQIESSGNPNAYNPSSKATGLYQITPICLKDFNLNARSGHFSLEEMKDPNKAKIVASWYFFKRLPGLIQHLGYESNEETLLIGYNCGPKCVKRQKLPKQTQDYLKKYRRLTHGA